MSRIAVFPGSFDPMTNAHLDVARRAADLFDRLVVGVLNNPKKQALFAIDDRVASDPRLGGLARGPRVGRGLRWADGRLRAPSRRQRSSCAACAR